MRHIQKWLNAGVMEEGKRVEQEEGTPQGGSISPLLANVYLHYVLDLWADQWRKTQAQGDVIIVRYADDFVVGFQHESDARRFLEELRERFRRFNLELHAEKTRVIEFGRFAAERRERRGEGKPETFNFLGFTHIVRQNPARKFIVLRQTIAKRMHAKLVSLKEALRRRMHLPVAEVGRWLGRSAQRSLPLLRRTPQLPGVGSIPRPGAAALASGTKPTQPEEPDQRNTMSRIAACWLPDRASATLIPRPSGRHDPRQEPGAVIPPAGICAGGGGQPPSLPRLSFSYAT